MQRKGVKLIHDNRESAPIDKYIERLGESAAILLGH